MIGIESKNIEELNAINLHKVFEDLWKENKDPFKISGKKIELEKIQGFGKLHFDKNCCLPDKNIFGHIWNAIIIIDENIKDNSLKIISVRDNINYLAEINY